MTLSVLVVLHPERPHVLPGVGLEAALRRRHSKPLAEVAIGRRAQVGLAVGRSARARCPARASHQSAGRAADVSLQHVGQLLRLDLPEGLPAVAPNRLHELPAARAVHRRVARAQADAPSQQGHLVP